MKITRGAEDGLRRCHAFLADRNPLAAKKAADEIRKHLALLLVVPDIGKPHPLYPEFRELTIKFGRSGYVALYVHVPAEDMVYVLAFKHQKEAGYIDPDGDD